MKYLLCCNNGGRVSFWVVFVGRLEFIVHLMVRFAY